MPDNVLPTQLILRPSRSRALVRFVFFLTVTVGYIWLLVLYADCFLLWVFALGSGLLTLAALRRVFDRIACLRLTSQGFAAYDRTGVIAFAWGDIREFRPGPRGRMVVFDYARSGDEATTARKVAHFVAGGDGALPDTYGLTARELAALLNEWRERFTAPGG